jgi:hypothetical protein
VLIIKTEFASVLNGPKENVCATGRGIASARRIVISLQVLSKAAIHLNFFGSHI